MFKQEGIVTEKAIYLGMLCTLILALLSSQPARCQGAAASEPAAPAAAAAPAGSEAASAPAAAPGAALGSVISTSTSAPAASPEPEIRLGDHTIDAQQREAGTEEVEGVLSYRLRQLLQQLPPTALGIRPRDQATYLVRLKSRQMQQAREQIVKLGGLIAATDSPAATFIVNMDSGVAAKVEALPQVAFVKRWLPTDKLSASLAAKISSLLPQPPSAGAGSTPANRGKPKAVPALEVAVALFPDEASTPVASYVKNTLHGVVLPPVGSWASIGATSKLRVRVPADKVVDLAAQPAVWLLDLELPAILHNDHALHILRASDLPAQHHLTGVGQVIGHADTGIDTGVDDGTLHADLRGRIAMFLPHGRPWDSSDVDGHGTHTAASLVGTGKASGGLYRGIAPDAQLVHQSLDDGKGNLILPANFGKLYEEAYSKGARIHCDSWGIDGAGTGGLYGLHSRELDTWAWNGGHPHDMLIVCSAGNSGPVEHSISQPATAKNCLVVGASKTDREGLGNADEVDASSSRGPTADGRIKPDLVAPGTWIASARTQAEKVVWQASPETPEGWQVPEPFSWSTEKGRSGAHSWRYVGEPGSAHGDARLVSPPLALPEGGPPLVLEVALAGKLGQGYSVQSQISVDGGDWEPLGPVEGPLYGHWTTQQFDIPDVYQGQDQVRLAIEVSAVEPSEGIDLFLDGFRITTLHSWGYLADEGQVSRGDPLDRLYTFEGGTSMAAPMVCGAAALVRQFFQEDLHVTPSAELIKAALINGAKRLGSGAWPDFAQGWGRVDVEGSTYPGPDMKLLFQDGVALSEGQTSTTWFTATASTSLRLTLAWCDPPGDRLVNNLDMVLFDPDGERHLTLGANGESPDTRNNVKGIALPSAKPGLWRVEITAKTLGQGTAQPFALVISGAVQAARAPGAAGDAGSPAAPITPRAPSAPTIPSASSGKTKENVHE